MARISAVTPHKRLHAGKSVWMADRAGVKISRLKSSAKADVVVVGAGISGAFMAHGLSSQYEKVIVLERRAPAHGATQASTAMLQFEIDEPLTRLADKIGFAKAADAWRRSFNATQDIRRLVRAEGIRCGFQSRGSLYLAGHDMGGCALKSEARARSKIGIASRFLDKGELNEAFSIDRSGAIASSHSAIANPVQLATGLLRRACAKGAVVYSPADVCDVIATSHGVILDTGQHFVEAKHVVFCTGYEVLKGIPTKGTKITSSWATATRPNARYPKWLDRMVVWEASTPYLYLRTTPDGRLVAGGEDEDVDLPTYRARSIDRKAAKISAKVQRLIPDIMFHPTYKWTGAFGESADGLPVIDAVPDMPGCFVVMGFGGNGTVYSMIASQIVASLLRGRPDKDAGLYRFR